MNKLANDIAKEVLKDSTLKTPVILSSKKASQVDVPGRWNVTP